MPIMLYGLLSDGHSLIFEAILSEISEVCQNCLRNHYYTEVAVNAVSTTISDEDGLKENWLLFHTLVYSQRFQRPFQTRMVDFLYLG